VRSSPRVTKCPLACSASIKRMIAFSSSEPRRVVDAVRQVLFSP
jgi:hypothetical protein